MLSVQVKVVVCIIPKPDTILVAVVFVEDAIRPLLTCTKETSIGCRDVYFLIFQLYNQMKA